MSASPSPDDLRAAGASPERAAQIAQGLSAVLALESGAGAWRRVGGELLRRADPPAVHRAAFDACYADHDPTLGPPPAWSPEPAQIARTNIARLGPTWRYVHQMSVQRPQAFWPRILDSLGVAFDPPPQTIVQGDGAEARWLPDARFNLAASCLARGRDDDLALLHQAPGGAPTPVTRAELKLRAEGVAWALLASGFEPGDTLALALPWCGESAVLLLGAGLAGCAVAGLPADRSAAELRAHLDAVGARAVVARGPEVYARLCAIGAPPAFVLPTDGDPPLREGDVLYSDFLGRDPGGPFVPHPSPPHQATVHFGPPAGLHSWTQLEPLKAAADAHVHLDLRAGDILAWPADRAHASAPWAVFAALLNGVTLAIFEGAARSREFCCFVADARVTKLGLTPALVAGWRADGLLAGLDWHDLVAAATWGGATCEDDVFWLMQQVGYRVPVLEYPLHPELGGAFVAGTLVEAQAPGAASGPAVGTSFVLLDPEGRQTSDGEVALTPPVMGTCPPLRPGARLQALGGGAYRRPRLRDRKA